MKVLNERYITKYEAAKILKENLENAKSFQKEVYENIVQFSEEIENLEEKKKRLRDLGLFEKEVVQILDFNPKSYEDILILFGKEIVKIDEELAKKILETLK